MNSPPRVAVPLLRQTGLLLPLVVLLGAFAAWVTATTTLPFSYTWFRPLEILKDVLRGEGFPTAAWLVACVGLSMRRSSNAPKGGLRARLSAARSKLASRTVHALHLARKMTAVQKVPALQVWRDARRDPDADVQRACDDWIGVLRALLLVFGLYVGALAIDANYHLFDWLALLPIGIVLGFRIPEKRRARRALLELCLVALAFTLVSYGFTVLKASLFLTGAPHDAAIIDFERSVLGWVPHERLAAWAAERPRLVHELDRVYYHLFEHMVLVSIFLSTAGRNRERVEYLSALALCYILGGFAYHFMPALGPAFWEPNRYVFLRHQPLITNLFQPLLFRNTQAAQNGTLERLASYEFIACMPSLHLAHEFVMLYYARSSWIAFAASLVFTSLTVVAVVVLGWHYPTDVLAGLALCAIAIFIARSARTWLLPARIMPAED